MNDSSMSYTNLSISWKLWELCFTLWILIRRSNLESTHELINIKGSSTNCTIYFYFSEVIPGLLGISMRSYTTVEAGAPDPQGSFLGAGGPSEGEARVVRARSRVVPHLPVADRAGPATLACFSRPARVTEQHKENCCIDFNIPHYLSSLGTLK